MLIILLFAGIQVFSQESFFEESTPETKEQAIKLTDEYNKELALDTEQIVSFQQKVEEFLLRRNEIDQEFSGKARLYNLVKLQEEQYTEMHNILTQSQLEAYKKYYSIIQPIGMDTKE